MNDLTPPIINGDSVSRETFDALLRFQELVLKWTPKINLISKADHGDVWNRHIVDSFQVFEAAPAEFEHWVDIGSGGGFPAIVVSAIMKERLPKARMTMVESDQRKATFLRTAIRELGLNAKVLSERIEAVEKLDADVLSARALASLDRLLSFAGQHVTPNGVAIFPKGQKAEQEIAEAERNWVFDLSQRPSTTDPTAKVLTIWNIQRA